MIYGFGFSISAILAIPAILAISSDPRLSASISGKVLHSRMARDDGDYGDFGKVVGFMLDLAYVRENLTQIEEMLRRRGMDPAQVLSGFRQVDEKRRQLITQSETLKAQRNRASEEIARLKKSGQDATTQMEQTKALRAQSDDLEKQAGEIDQEMRTMLAGIPNVPHESVPVGRSADDNKECASGACRRSSALHPSRTGSWASNWACWTWNARSS